MESFWINDNKLSGPIPDAYVGMGVDRDPGMAALLTLDCRNNALSGTLPAIAAGKPCSTLKLSHNKFTGSIPEHFLDHPTDAYWVSECEIELDDNMLTGTIPSQVSMGYLNLSHNMLTGTIPSLEYGISRLYGLDASHNRLDHWNESNNGLCDGTFAKVQSFCHLEGNPFRCPVPDCASACNVLNCSGFVV